MVDVTDSEQWVEDRNQDGLRQDFSSEELTDEIKVSIKLHSEKNLRLFADITFFKLGDIEEFLKACLAHFKQGSSEDRVFHGLDRLLKVLQFKLQLDHLFAKFSVEDAVLLLNLSLAEDVVDDCLEDVISDFFRCEFEVFTVLNAFFLAFFTSF